MTKSVCGPLFDVAPVDGPKYPISWSKGCLEYNATVRDWLKQNPSIKYAVLSSPFNRFTGSNEGLLFRNGNESSASISIAVEAFEKTLNELESMAIKPIVFSPPPANGVNLGRCLARAEMRGVELNTCNFRVDEMTEERVEVYQFLAQIEKNHKVVRLDQLICDDSLCNAHFDSTYVFRDEGHLSYAGSFALGKKHDFYSIITGD